MKRIAVCLIGLGLSSAVFADGLEGILKVFGTPDAVQSTEYDVPRPPFVTKFLDYKKERVRVILLPDAPIGSPPPYRSWIIIGATDPITNKSLPPAEFERRMAKRKRY